MIVICHRVLTNVSQFEWQFLRYYLTELKQKAIVSNEVWSSFRYRIAKKNGEEIGEKTIIDFRGSFRPEEIKLNEDFEEVEPKDYEDEVLSKSTISLIERKWADVDSFIVNESGKYEHINGIKPITLSRWYLDQMNTSVGRRLIQIFSEEFAHTKYE